MEKTEIKIGSDYMDFVSKFHTVLKEQNIVLVYEGDVNQSITKAFTAMTEQNVEGSDDSEKTKKRLYHVMVECLQNIAKHADDIETGEPIKPGKGIFIVTRDNDKYSVTTGNIIANEKVAGIKEMITTFNGLNSDELKDTYKKMIKESILSEKAGAGLGFIDIVKKTGNKIDCHFEPINNKTSLFIQKSDITREI